jgi:hypothetical protein
VGDTAAKWLGIMAPSAPDRNFVAIDTINAHYALLNLSTLSGVPGTRPAKELRHFARVRGTLNNGFRTASITIAPLQAATKENLESSVMVDFGENNRGKNPRRTVCSAPQLSPQASDCRKKALECRRRALLATDKVLRETYFDLAHQWLDMAEQVEALDRLKS